MIAQLEEQETENLCVSGSIPLQATIYECVAQSVEHLTFNQRVRGSIPLALTKWRLSPKAVEGSKIFLSDLSGVGSNPTVSIHIWEHNPLRRRG